MAWEASQKAAWSPFSFPTPGFESISMDFLEIDETWDGTGSFHSLGPKYSNSSGINESGSERESDDAKFCNAVHPNQQRTWENYSASEPSLASENFLLEDLMGNPLSSTSVEGLSPGWDASQMCPSVPATDNTSEEANQETGMKFRPQGLEGRLRMLVREATKRTGQSLSNNAGYPAGNTTSSRHQQAGLPSSTTAIQWNAIEQLVGGMMRSPEVEDECRLDDDRIGNGSWTEARLGGHFQRGSSRVGSVQLGLAEGPQVQGGIIPLASAEDDLHSRQVFDLEGYKGNPGVRKGTWKEYVNTPARWLLNFGAERKTSKDKLPFILDRNASSQILMLSRGWNVELSDKASNRKAGNSPGSFRDTTPKPVGDSNVHRGVVSSNNFLERDSSMAGRFGGQADSLSKAVPSLVPSLSRNMQLDTPRNLLHGRLIGLAEALATSDEIRVCYLSTLVKEEASPKGDSMQRMAFYVLEGLKLRSLGEGHLYTERLPPIDLQVQETVFFSLMERMPFLPFMIECTKEIILATVVGERNVHLIDFWLGLADWEGLLTGLATRPEGPPYLRVTLVHVTDARGLSYDATAMGMALTQMAERLGIPLEWHTFKTRLMDFQASMVTVLPDEAVVLNCGMGLQPLADSSVLRSNPRDQMLQVFNGLNPRVILLTDLTIDLNSQFFLKRLKDCLDFFLVGFRAIEEAYLTEFSSDCSERTVVEQRMFADELVNVIACEGLDMWVRPERHETWQGRMRRAGFTTLPVPASILATLQERITGRHPQYTVEARQGAVFLKWRESPFAWTGAFRQCF